jgi:hypothetical protein
MGRVGFAHVSAVVQGPPVPPPLELELELDEDWTFVVDDEQAAPTAANPETPARSPSTAARRENTGRMEPLL